MKLLFAYLVMFGAQFLSHALPSGDCGVVVDHMSWDGYVHVPYLNLDQWNTCLVPVKKSHFKRGHWQRWRNCYEKYIDMEVKVDQWRDGAKIWSGYLAAGNWKKFTCDGRTTKHTTYEAVTVRVGPQYNTSTTATFKVGDILTQADLSCAVEGRGSTVQCGAKKGVDTCCGDLVCHSFQRWRCVKEENKQCAGEGTISKECSCTLSSKCKSQHFRAAPKCCDGLVCGEDKKCVEEPWYGWEECDLGCCLSYFQYITRRLFSLSL